jgi:ELWxxDGT repeat protein
MGDKFYFSSLNWNGSERDIYVSDGTEEGTYSTNIGHEGYGGSSRLNFGESKFVFVRDTEDYGEELWISDGTEGGTHLVKDIREGDKDADIDSVVPVGDTFYFGAAAITNQGVLWKTDGTEEGTVVINLPEGRTAVNVGETGRNMILLKNDLIYAAFGNRGDSGDEYRYFGYGSEFWILKNVSSAYGATPSYTLYKDVAMNPITFDYDGADATWEISPDLPPSLSFNSANGTITGIPDELFNLTSYTVYANITAGTPPDSILYYNVGDDDDGDGYWEDTHGNDDYDIAISNLDRVEVTGNTDLTHAYRFDSSSDLAVMGNNFQDWAGDLTDDSISIEMWFNPSALSGNKILWEIGGTSNGNSLVLMGDELTYRLKTSGDNAYVNISTTISQDSEFHNAVVVLNKEAEMAYLYYDGELKANASFSGDFDWGGNNDAGIGCENDNVGGYTNSEQTDYFSGDTTFRGDIAIHRILEVALDSSEVEDLYGQFTSYRFKETYEIKLQSLQHPDSDGDGICDGALAVDGICAAGPDAFPFDAAASVDTDDDGMPDTLTGNSTSEPPLVEDLDDDNDGLLDLDEIANGTEPLNPDTDGDGYCDGSVTVGSCIAGDVFPTDVTEWFDTDGDGTGDNADLDDDNDGLDDTTEASSDPVTNSTNPDTDGDGVCDGSVNVTINDSQICIGGPDELPTNPNETVDTDGDGIGNNEDTDDDNDGLSDDEEIVIGTDPLDPDTDGDFYCDGPIVVTGCAGSDDAFPLDDGEWLDTDGDGIGNNADPDDDGDSYDDIWENENGYDPLDGCDPNLNSSACDQDYDGLNNGEENALGTNVTNPDTDGDGFCDGDLGVEGICVAGPDDFPLDPAAHLDTDKDGMPDTLNGTSTSEPALIEDLDDDNDSLLDLDEIANGTEPLNPDTDGDGYCDGSVTVGSCIAGDVFPLDENEWFDTDGDGTGNNADTDDDNDGLNDTTEASSDPVTNSTNPDTDGDGYCDGPVSITDVCDATDAFPTDGNEWNDNDNDGTGDNADLDDDNDGLDDITEASSDPATNSTNPDTDGDGYCDGLVNITDICVATDTFPTTATEWFDTDGDGTGNNADLDDDGDGYNDTMEISEGSDPLDSENIPLDTDGDFDPDSTDLDDDNDGFDDADDAFPTNSAEWLDTDDDGTGNNADTDDDNDGIPDNWDPMPVDPDGDFDKDGILDRDEYKPNADGEPADADADGKNDMLQALASGSNTSSSDRSWKEMCCWVLLLLLLLLFPLGKKRYDNSLVYDPHEINYVIGDNESKIRAVPSLHEYTKKYIKLVNKDGLKNITYGISGDLNDLEIDSKTGVISGHPEKTGKYIYEITMKHSKGKYTGELIVNVTSKDEKVEKPEEPEASTPALSSNPEPENTSSKPKFKGGAGTKMDPFVITPAKGLAAGEQISSKQVIMISGLKPGGVVNMEDIDSSKNGKRFAIVSEPDEVGRQSALVADDDGKIKFRINFKDDEPSYDGADYEGLIKLGTASVYLSWAVEVIKEESEEVSEPEPVVEEPEEEEPLSKEEKKQKELERIKTRSEKIDFNVLGEATNSTLSKPVEMDANEIELEDASEFEKKGTATITDVDGSEIITWTSKKGNALFGIAGLTRAFVAASIVVAKDDLQVIKGIGPFIEEKLNALGIYMFVQIARMTPKLEEEVNIAIEFFPGRVKRDEWVKQASELAK